MAGSGDQEIGMITERLRKSTSWWSSPFIRKRAITLIFSTQDSVIYPFLSNFCNRKRLRTKMQTCARIEGAEFWSQDTAQ